MMKKVLPNLKDKISVAETITFFQEIFEQIPYTDIKIYLTNCGITMQYRECDEDNNCWTSKSLLISPIKGDYITWQDVLTGLKNAYDILYHVIPE